MTNRIWVDGVFEVKLVTRREGNIWAKLLPNAKAAINRHINQEFEELLESLPEYKAIGTNGRSYGYNQAISEIRNLVKKRMKADS